MQKKITKNPSSPISLVFLGTSLASLAASTYFLFIKKDAKNVKHAKSWAIKMKADVIEKLELARSITEPVYQKIIDTVATNYERSKKLDAKDVKALAQDLKSNWKVIASSAQAMKDDVVTDTKKIIKKLSAEPKKLSAPKLKKTIKNKLVAPAKKVTGKVSKIKNKITKKS